MYVYMYVCMYVYIYMYIYYIYYIYVYIYHITTFICFMQGFFSSFAKMLNIYEFRQM